VGHDPAAGWVTLRPPLKIIKGFVLDDDRLKQGKAVFGKDYFDELLERIREIRASERRFANVDARQTFYAAQFPDGFAAEVLFLVRTPGRASSINAALARWRQESRCLWPRLAEFRGVTFDEAAAELRRLVGLPPLPLRQPMSANVQSTSAAPALPSEEAELLRRYLFESTNAIHRARAAFRELGRADLPKYPQSLDTFRALVGRLSGAAPPS